MRELDLFFAMQVLVEVVEAGSFTRASEKLRVTPSAVSKQVARLESHLGVSLLRRTTRQMDLTEEGQSYVTQCRQILAQVEQAHRSVKIDGDEPKGTLRVSAPTLLGQVHLSALIPPFLAVHPGLTVELSLSDRKVDIVREGWDVVLRIAQLAPSTLIGRKVMDERRVLCASPAYAQRHGLPKVPPGLADHSCLGFLSGGQLAAWSFTMDDGSVYRFRDFSRFVADQTWPLYQATIGDVGIANLPRYLVEDDLREGRLLPLFEELLLVERGIWLLYASVPFVPPKIRVFVDAMVEGLRRLSGLTEGRDGVGL